MKKILFPILIVMLTLVFAGCTGAADDKAKQPNNEKGAKQSDKGNEIGQSDKGNEQPNEENQDPEAVIGARAQEAVLTLKNGDMERLADLVHPVKGVRFSPYAYVNTDTDGGNLVFRANQVREFPNDNKKYTWGHYDGTGEPIILTPMEYFKKFVYTADFANAEKVSYNETIGTGNALENQFEVYPDAIIVEYYFSGFEEQYQGMDWQSLRLVFEELENTWYLAGIIHNQWTS